MSSDPRSTADVGPAKRALRRQMRRRLATVQSSDARTWSRAIAERVLGLERLKSARQLLVCLSFGSEPHTWDLVEALQQRGQVVLVPRVVPGRTLLTVHRFPCSLETLPMGLQQPDSSVPALSPTAVAQTDATLIPGLAFDRQAYRLGYGGGYFDRFFSTYPVTGYGLAYGLQLVDELPVEAHDLPLHAVITEEGVAPSARA